MRRISFENAAAHLDTVWDQVERSGTPVVIRRQGHEDMALVPAADLRGLRETVHLLRSPRNAARLLTAIARSRGEEPPGFRSAELGVRDVRSRLPKAFRHAP